MPVLAGDYNLAIIPSVDIIYISEPIQISIVLERLSRHKWQDSETGCEIHSLADDFKSFVMANLERVVAATL
ncbi:hypothetical protein PspLS_06908 [Pyricularia sp. CBS 133598]|nr:hypothetical protein PspLS_06908 [Pyricularia sp. CBS 133598]